GFSRNANGATRIAAPFPAANSPRDPASAQCVPTARSRSAFRVLDPTPRIRPARNQRKKGDARFSGSTPPISIIDSQLARVSCVSSENADCDGTSNSTRPPAPSYGLPQASPKAPPSKQPSTRLLVVAGDSTRLLHLFHCHRHPLRPASRAREVFFK